VLRSFYIEPKGKASLDVSRTSSGIAGSLRMATCTILWFRRDLRLEDNPALIAAARAGSVVPVYIWAPEEDGQFRPGRVSRWWLKQSLRQLEASLKTLGSPLVIRKSHDSLSVLLEIVQATGATQVFYNHLYGECLPLPRMEFLQISLFCQPGMAVLAIYRDMSTTIILIMDKAGKQRIRSMNTGVYFAISLRRDVEQLIHCVAILQDDSMVVMV
jgi:hypothetical protein